MSTLSPEAQTSPILPSARGLVLGCNQRGNLVDLTTLRQWLRVCAQHHLVRKVDYWQPRADATRLSALLEEARAQDLRLSLRTTPETDPEILKACPGLLDVLLCMDRYDHATLNSWCEACAAVGVALRVQMNAPGGDNLADHTTAKKGMVHVSLVLKDPLSAVAGPVAFDSLMETARHLLDIGIEAHLHDIPFCAVLESLWPCVTGSAQRLAGHTYYQPESFDFAMKLRNLPPRRISQAVEIALSQGVSFHNLVDDTVLPWIQERPRWFFWLWFLHKLTRRLPLRRPTPAPLPEGEDYIEQRLREREADRRRELGAVCATCRFHPICDHPGEVFKQAFPDFVLKPVPGAPVHDPLAFRSQGPVYYDAIDEARRHLDGRRAQLADAAQRRLAGEAPTREIPAESYEIADHATHRMPASVRWHSFSTAELQSTVLARLTPPFTLAMTVGGGIADRVGFAFGRQARIMCPMTATSHQIALHVDEQGEFVLLRDGVAVPPVAFHDAHRVPERLAGVVDPRIALINVDGQIVTQTVLLWEGVGAAKAIEARHSVIIVCARFSRRLQAVLRALARQNLVADLEVLVAYVPGLDATDDVLDSAQLAWPGLRVVRMPFAADRARAKGFMINECLQVASGSWITLLDADILLPVDYFTRLDALPDSAMFAAPDGRHMLDPATTARILLGEIDPTDHYNTLAGAAPEYRHHESEGVPPGFCQSLRREVFGTLRYGELDHFEGSDWWFGKQVMDTFGPVARLSGVGVLHLDHGGSQWYGTGKQR